MQPHPSPPCPERDTNTSSTRYQFAEVELHLTSPLYSCDLMYAAGGVVRLESAKDSLAGCSVRIRSLITGLAEEAFLDEHGAFAQDLELQPETDNPLEFAVCDGVGRELARFVAVVRHQGREPERAPRVGSVSDGEKPSLTLPARSPMLDPPWPRFAQLVQRCLDLAAEVADKTGRDRDELYDPIRAQERYAEQAFEQRNQPLYHECNDNLEKYGGYLKQLLGDALPRPSRPTLPPDEEARLEVKRFRASLSAVWKQVREKQRTDLEARLTDIATQARGLSQRAKKQPLSVLRQINRLRAEVEKVAQQLDSATRCNG